MAELAVADELSDEQRSELDAIERGTPDLERQLRAATIAVERETADPETRTADDPDAEQRERVELRSRAQLTNFCGPHCPANKLTRISHEAILYRWICDLLGGSEWRCVEVVFSVGPKWAGSGSWVRKGIGFVDFGYEGSFACWDVLAFFGCRRWVGTMGAPERREP